ncbi:MAG: alkaline phosphatase family protein [Acidobacteriota bacterium]
MKILPGPLLCLALLVASPSVTARQQERESHVVLISIDGLAAYHLENPTLVLPHIRQMIAEGVWAKGVKTVFPSVTHPSHTTMITGVAPRVHGVIGNRMTDRRTGKTFHITNKLRSESIKVGTVFDAAKAKGLVTAAFFWPETQGDPSIDFNIPEVFGSNGLARMDAAEFSFMARFPRIGIPIDLYFRWYGTEHLRGAADIILAQSAASVLEKERPHLLAIHLLSTDVMQHHYGPDHYLSQTAITTADFCVGLLLDAARSARIADRTTFLVTADHGFHAVRYDLNLAPLFQELGGRVKLHSQAWTLFVELGPTFEPQRDRPLLERILRKALEIEGVARVVRPDEFHQLGYPTYQENAHVPGQYMILGDIDTHLKAGPPETALKRAPKKHPYFGHGYLPGHPRMEAAFVAFGHRIRRGRRIGVIEEVSIAPTISELLGIETVGSRSNVLKEALDDF